MKFKGLIAAACTPFNENGTLALERIPSLTDYLISQKLAGLFVCGSAGEGYNMTDGERKQTADAFVKAGKNRIPMIVHVGSESLKEAEELAAHAQSIGADAIAAVAPCYIRPANIGILVDCMRRISSAAPELPFYYYHIPVLSGVNFPMLDFLVEAEKHIPALAGIKFTHENMMDFQLSLNYRPERFQLLFGRDEMLLCGLASGAAGAVGSTYNFAAPLYHKLIKAFESGDLESARKYQLTSQKMIRLFGRFGGGVVKQIMGLIGQNVGPARLPKANHIDKNRELADLLRSIGMADLLGGDLFC